MYYLKDSTYYKIKGFVNILESIEFDKKENLFFKNRMFNSIYDLIKHNTKYPTENIIDAATKKHFGFDSELLFQHNFQYFVFEKVKEINLFNDVVVYKNPTEYLIDYLEKNDILLIKTINRINNEKILPPKIENHFQYPTIIKNGFIKTNKSNYNNVKKEQKEEIKKETKTEQLEYFFDKIIKNEDYVDFYKKYKINLLEIQEKVIKQAKLNGGFIEFEYNGVMFNIPKTPYKIWQLRYISNNNPQFSKDVNNRLHWKPISSYDIKTENDDIIHSDWWIGAGFPMHMYQLFSKKTEALNNRLFDIDNTLAIDDVIFFAKSESSYIKGELKMHYDTSIKEGDIVICPNASIEFDEIIRKVGKSGAIIVELGNKVAHLPIVARELGNTVAFLPHASSYLNENLNNLIVLDLVNNKISLPSIDLEEKNKAKRKFKP